MLQQQITSNLQFQAVTLTNNCLQEYLKFYSDYIHRNHSFPEVPQNQKLSAHFPFSFKHNVTYHFLCVQKLRQKTTEHCKVTQIYCHFMTPVARKPGQGGKSKK